jgi:hypothetical protein
MAHAIKILFFEAMATKTLTTVKKKKEIDIKETKLKIIDPIIVPANI